MEADVAIHAPEKWAAGDSRYDQPEKVKYIYSNRLREQKVKSAARRHMTPSKSYDNELETSVARETSLSSEAKVTKVKDDLSLTYGTKPGVSQRSEGKTKVQPQTETFSSAVKEKQKEHVDGAQLSSPKKDKRKHRDKTHGKKSRHTKPKETAASHGQGTKSATQDVTSSHDRSEKPIPIEFHLTQDQLALGPTAHMRPVVNTSSFSSTPPSSLSFSSDKPSSSLVILEVKDGPTFFYKPSSHMVSDSAFGYDASCSGNASNSALHISEESYPSNGSGNNISSDVKFSSAGASMSSTLRSSNPKLAAASSPLPKSLSLRKPDLSVLKMSTKSDSTVVDNGSRPGTNASTDQHMSKMEGAATEIEISDVAPVSLPISPTLTMPPTADTQTEPVSHVPTVRQCHTAAAVTDDSGTCSTVSPSQPGANENPAILDTSISGTPYDSPVFQNVSEILQLKAGIKHDDIVVGPRSPRVGRSLDQITADMAKNSPNAEDGHSFVIENTASHSVKQERDQAVLSFNADTYSEDLPILSLKSDSPKHSFSEIGAPGSTMNDDVLLEGNCVEDFSRNPPIQHFSTELNASQNTPSLDQLQRHGAEESAKDVHKFKGSKIRPPKFGIAKRAIPELTERSHAGKTARPGSSDITLCVPSDDSSQAYATKSLDRMDRSVGETRLKSKSANSSPIKLQQQQQQSRSPKSKSSTSTPVKKQQALPRLHMLSNIPVPISYDPPAKRNSYYKPQQESHAGDTAELPQEQVSRSSPETPTTNNTAKARDSMETKPSTSEAPMELAQEVIQSPSTCLQTSTEVPIDSKHHKAENSSLPQSMDSSPKKLLSNHSDGPGTSKIMISTSDGNTISTNNATANAEKAIEEKSVLTEADANLVLASSKLDDEMPSQVPVKPRFHRSAEHLHSDAKLSIFNSIDSIEQVKGADMTKKRADSTRSEKRGVDSISPLRKNQGLAKIGIMRRGSDRTYNNYNVCRRGSERAIVPISRHDPSVEDLKNATSLKELCQSVASLLHIDNERAAEMITTSLSQRQDLVEGLDADAILDYLSHHGVLDPAVLVGLDATTTQRNSTILKHVEEHGNTAVALFINALRQSGQLHLASSLDTEQRIKPMSGNGYFGKDRHKGELTVRIEIEALKIMAPREPRTDKIVDSSLLVTPTRQMPDDTNGFKVMEDDDDYVKPKSCWCFCFSRKSKAKKDTDQKKKSAGKKPGERPQTLSRGNEMKPPEHEDMSHRDAAKSHKTKSKEKNKKGKSSKQTDVDKSSKARSRSKSKEKYAVHDVADTSKPNHPQALDSVPEVTFKSGRGDIGSETRHGESPYLESSLNPYQVSPQTNNGRGVESEKESRDAIIMEYDPKLELVKLRAGQEELASPTRQSGTVGFMCEQWKSNGRHFLQKATLLCDRIIEELQTEIVKYFEQDRGTLVFDVRTDSSAILVISICMKRAQVRSLQQEVENESLLDKMQDMFFSKVDIAEFDIRGVKLKVVLDDQEVNAALSELSS